MQPFQWYVSSIEIILLSTVVYLVYRFLKQVWGYIRYYTWVRWIYYRYQKNIYYRQGILIPNNYNVTLIEQLLLLGFIIANVLSCVIGVKDTNTLMKRVGLAAILNLIPLVIGSHVNFIIDLYDLRVGSFERLHRWLGRIFVLQTLIHSAIALAKRKYSTDLTSKGSFIVNIPRTLSL